MENVNLLVDLAYAMGAALLGGFLAHLLRQPAILGFLAAGIVIGPYTMGLVRRVEDVQTLANLGVALLMFALGTEFSLEGLRRVGRVAVFGGLIQILLTIALGFLIGFVSGYPPTSSIFLGGTIAISSSILMLKLLMARGELDSLWGRVAIGIGIVQDISIVALIIILPELAGGGGWALLGDTASAILRGGGFLVIAYLVGTRVVPIVFTIIARAGSRELFILMVVAVAAGTAVLGHVVGISFALGAFVGGLIVSESEFSGSVLDEIIPVRDIFATLFFVSIGMLLDYEFLLLHAGEIILLLGGIMVGKFVITTMLVRAFRFSWVVSLRVGLLIAQIGEFSFVLASVGAEKGLLSDELYRVILASALASLVFNSILFNNARTLGNTLRRLLPGPEQVPGAMAGWGLFRERQDAAEEEQSDDLRLANLRRHVVICGYGRVGKEVSRALHRRDFAFALIDYNPGKVVEARGEGFLVIQGDATNPVVLRRAGVGRAKLLVVTLPDLTSVEQIVRVGRQMNPRLHIVARTQASRSIDVLRQAGANEVVQPEFEAGMEMLRKALRNYGVSAIETQSITGGRRTEHYSTERGLPVGEDRF